MIDQVSNESRPLAFKFSPRRRTAADVIDGQHVKCVFATAGARLAIMLEDFDTTVSSEFTHIRTKAIAILLLTLAGVRQFLIAMGAVILASFSAIVIRISAVVSALSRLHRSGMGSFPFLDRLAHLSAASGETLSLGQC